MGASWSALGGSWNVLGELIRALDPRDKLKESSGRAQGDSGSGLGRLLLTCGINPLQAQGPEWPGRPLDLITHFFIDFHNHFDVTNI